MEKKYRKNFDIFGIFSIILLSENDLQAYLFKMIKDQQILFKRFLVSFLLFFKQFLNNLLRFLQFNYLTI